MPVRPHGKELHKKLRAALTALQEGRCRFQVHKHLVADLDALDVDTAALIPLLCEFIQEILSSDPESCYCGKSPPEFCYEPQLKGEELWPFTWRSPSQGKVMYLKFVIRGDAYEHVTIHESKF